MKVIQQQKQQDPGVVSSHGYVVDNSAEYVAPKSENPAEDPAAEAVDNAAAAAAGKESSEGKEATEGSAAEEGKGENSTPETAAAGPDLNSILNEIMGIKQALANPEQPGQQQADPLAEVDQALAALEQQAKDGEISHEELVMKTVPLIEQRVQINTERRMQEQAQAKSVSDAQGAFIAQNPDFVAFAQSPEAQALVASNPVLDNVSAYYAAKHMQATAENQTLRAELDALKATQAEAIKNAGKTQAKVVGSDAGTDAGVDKLYRGDGLSAQQGGIAALRRARAQQ